MAFLFFFCIVLLFCGIEDSKTMHIPPRYPLLIAACFWLNPMWNKQDSFIGFVVCGGVLLLLCCVKEGAFGGGDIKLCAAVGFTLGSIPAIAGLLLASLFSLPAAFVKRRQKTAIAFAPYLAAGFSLAAFFNYFSYGGFI